ncbi:MAG: hypothetical protein R6X34_24520 [Chloroflexota bacterium]
MVAAGQAVDQLAAEYTNQPVLLLEQDVDHTVGNRYGRWWDAYDGPSPAWLPFVMVGSGYRISNGSVDFYNVYKNMIEAEKARPPQADVTATYKREGGHYNVKVVVTNKSGQTLSYTNLATVHVLVYEETKVILTGRFVRAATSTLISSLAHGETASFNLTTADISPLDWNKVHVVALVDYIPASIDHFDTLQAAIATEGVDFEVRPDMVAFLIDPEGVGVTSTRLEITGPPQLTWQMTGGADWFSVTPTQGDVTNSPQISLVMANVADGWQEETLTFSAEVAHEVLQEPVLVKAYRGPVHYTYLPVIARKP